MLEKALESGNLHRSKRGMMQSYRDPVFTLKVCFFDLLGCSVEHPRGAVPICSGPEPCSRFPFAEYKGTLFVRLAGTMQLSLKNGSNFHTVMLYLYASWKRTREVPPGSGVGESWCFRATLVRETFPHRNMHLGVPSWIDSGLPHRVRLEQDLGLPGSSPWDPWCGYGAFQSNKMTPVSCRPCWSRSDGNLGRTARYPIKSFTQLTSMRLACTRSNSS